MSNAKVQKALTSFKPPTEQHGISSNPGLASTTARHLARHHGGDDDDWLCT